MTYKKYVLKGLKVNTKSLSDIIVLTCGQIAGILGHVVLCSYENAYTEPWKKVKMLVA